MERGIEGGWRRVKEERRMAVGGGRSSRGYLPGCAYVGECIFDRGENVQVGSCLCAMCR